MTTTRKFKYERTDLVESIEAIFNTEPTIEFNRWYCYRNTILYINEKFYYHFCLVRHNKQLGYYIDDFVVGKDGHEHFSKYYGYFTKDELHDFIMSKGLPVEVKK